MELICRWCAQPLSFGASRGWTHPEGGALYDALRSLRLAGGALSQPDPLSPMRRGGNG